MDKTQVLFPVCSPELVRQYLCDQNEKGELKTFEGSL